MPSLSRLFLPLSLLALAAPAAATDGPWHFYFAYGSDRLVEHSRQSLARFATMARQNPLPVTILASGFVDPREARTPAGRALACRRARTIARALVGQGMRRDRLVLHAGEDPPPEAPGARDPQRRRVAFTFHADPAAARAAATGHAC